MFNSFNDFIAWEKASRDTIDVKVCYLDLAGDIVTGLFLSQLVFWYLPNNTGRTKLRIFKEGEYWLARTNKDWYEEIRLTEKQVRRAIDELKKKGIIQTKVFKFNGSPTTHIRIIKEVFIEQLKQVIGISSVITESSTENADNTSFALEGKTENTQQNLDNIGSALQGNSICPTGHVEIDQRDKSITEITTEITTKNNNQSINQINLNTTKEGEVKEIDGLNHLFKASIVKQIGLGSREERFSGLEQNILELMVEVYNCRKETIRIAGEDKHTEEVKEAFKVITPEHIDYILGSWEKNDSKVTNIKAYLLTCIYNAPKTMAAYYTNQGNAAKVSVLKNKQVAKSRRREAPTFEEIHGVKRDLNKYFGIKS